MKVIEQNLNTRQTVYIEYFWDKFDLYIRLRAFPKYLGWSNFSHYASHCKELAKKQMDHSEKNWPHKDKRKA